jgi:hypothetical protein
MSRNQSSQKRIVVETPSARYRTTAGRYGSKPRSSEGWVAISVVAAAALATFGALFLTSRPYDPMNSTFDAQQGVPQAPIAMQSSPSPSPTPTPQQTLSGAQQTPEPAAEAPSPIPDDAGIQAQIERALSSDVALAQLDVSTIVEAGRVTIVGSVRSAELKQRVERTVRSIKGVLSVDNQLVVIEATP